MGTVIPSNRDQFLAQQQAQKGVFRPDDLQSSLRMIPTAGQEALADPDVHPSDFWNVPQMGVAAAQGAARVGQMGVSKALPMLRENVKPTIDGLTESFNRAITRHLSLPMEERIQSSRDAIEALRPHFGEGKNVPDLLSKNRKLKKAEEAGAEGVPILLPNGRGIETTGLSLSPAMKAGEMRLCSNFASCKEGCLGFTSGGNLQFGGGKDLTAVKGPRLAHHTRSMAMMNEPEAFAIKLNDEIESAKRLAATRGNQLGLRLNVLSDLPPSVHGAIIKAHPDVEFYDYTKNWVPKAERSFAPNHHLTYSSTGTSHEVGVNGMESAILNKHSNWRDMRDLLDEGENVAMSFSHKNKLPATVLDHETGKTFRVIDGDTHDYRPLDKVRPGEVGVIVGLRNKNRLSKQTTAHETSKGFHTWHDPNVSTQVEIPVQRRDMTYLDNMGKVVHKR